MNTTGTRIVMLDSVLFPEDTIAWLIQRLPLGSIRCLLQNRIPSNPHTATRDACHAFLQMDEAAQDEILHDGGLYIYDKQAPPAKRRRQENNKELKEAHLFIPFENIIL